jgi:hypothetical protein
LATRPSNSSIVKVYLAVLERVLKVPEGDKLNSRGHRPIGVRLSVGSAPTGRHYDSQGQSASVAPGRPTPLLPSPERAEEPLDPPSVMPPRWGLTGDALGFPGFRLSALPWAIAFRPCRGCSCLTWRVWGTAHGCRAPSDPTLKGLTGLWRFLKKAMSS